MICLMALDNQFGLNLGVSKTGNVWIYAGYAGFFCDWHPIKRYRERSQTSIMNFIAFHKYTLQLEGGILKLFNEQETLLECHVQDVKIQKMFGSSMLGGGFRIASPQNQMIQTGRPGLQWWADPTGKKQKAWINALIAAGASFV